MVFLIWPRFSTETARPPSMPMCSFFDEVFVFRALSVCFDSLCPLRCEISKRLALTAFVLARQLNTRVHCLPNVRLKISLHFLSHAIKVGNNCILVGFANTRKIIFSGAESTFAWCEGCNVLRLEGLGCRKLWPCWIDFPGFVRLALSLFAVVVRLNHGGRRNA